MDLTVIVRHPQVHSATLRAPLEIRAAWKREAANHTKAERPLTKINRCQILSRRTSASGGSIVGSGLADRAGAAACEVFNPVICSMMKLAWC
jgi:hypothetical protein